LHDQARLADGDRLDRLRVVGSENGFRGAAVQVLCDDRALAVHQALVIPRFAQRENRPPVEFTMRG
jgi:hypothetical protein